jgi:hypothetical protein
MPTGNSAAEIGRAIDKRATAGIAVACDFEHEPELNTEPEDMKRRGSTRIAKIFSYS